MSALTRKGSPEKRFIFLVSFAPGPTGSSPAELVMKVGVELDHRALARFPLLWHLPAADINADCARLFHDRIEAYGDSVVPMGLTGAPHPLLHIAEIASDVEWSIGNLWHSGLNDALHAGAPIIIPRTPDFLRGEALEAYGASAVPVGMLGTADDGLWISIAPTGVAPTGVGSSGALPVLDAESIGEPGRRALLRALARRQRDAKPVGGARPVVVRCCLTNDDDIERFVAILASSAEAVGKAKWNIAPLDLEAAAGPTPDLIAADVPHLAPSVATAATELRRRRSSKINTRRILEHVAGDGAGDSASGGSGESATARSQAPPHPPKRGERDFIASMMGQTSIPGTTMSAHFVGGALCGVHGADAKPAPPRPASTYILTADGRRVDEATNSCFSFESEISRGLRSECVIRDPDTGAEARIRTEYSFVGEYDALVATQHSFVDGGRPDDTLMVLGVPILERERCAITGRYRDGSTYDFDVSWKLPQVVLAAETFGIWDGESRYTFIPLTAACHPMLWTAVVLDRPEPQIVIGGRYPFGSPAEHHLSFLMIRGDIDDELAERALSGRLPAAIAEEIAAGTAAELSIRREPQEA